MIPTRQRKANSSKTAGAATVRLIAYTRVSTTKQAGEGVSLAAQRERLEAYAKAHGFELVELVEEAGVSGKTAPGSRPGLGGALDRIRRGEAKRKNWELLDELCETMELGSLCALGGLAPMPVRSVMKHFAGEL